MTTETVEEVCRLSAWRTESGGSTRTSTGETRWRFTGGRAPSTTERGRLTDTSRLYLWGIQYRSDNRLCRSRDNRRYRCSQFSTAILLRTLSAVLMFLNQSLL
ncbi:hypothetical protein J6590_030846 [Homalodisca vitripennis]|nr:hypothetical protein J6590_030846 [Homalodisca vitripennis]